MAYDVACFYKKCLENEYKSTLELNKIADGLIEVVPAPGQTPPFVEAYIAAFNFPTLVKAGNQIRLQNGIRVLIKTEGSTLFSRRIQAQIPAGEPVPFHPNWWDSGLMDNGMERMEMHELIPFLQFVFYVLQFQERYVNPLSPSNVEAARYWIEHRNDPGAFPTDTHPFPQLPERKKPKIVVR